ncbi:MAG TPA: hypothetical protein DDW94_11885 [Deltaproteobacteria bacterium]|nr:MAG: hypothetical protein A3I81_08215 [Deltaproteobacteria bacterium RIFCSPLOWO2_02_FULL_55_12]OIJ72758.1 MAG: hypothetical protein A2V21_313020 [Deltaproteobacteria bacterium GWC2_55_46]HBG47670.1 hypothetical protein [Deltaproteobacteria bacterium]HCY10581.1 hypothetical protein [Deltaproteobacteria bacterium]
MPGRHLGLLPHAYPFRLLDRVLELDVSRGVGIKNVTAGEALMAERQSGTFPDMLVVEALAQLSGLILNYDKEGGAAVLAQIKTMRFSRAAHAGEVLRLVSEAEASFGGLASFNVKALSGEEVIVEGALVLAGVNK